MRGGAGTAHGGPIGDHHTVETPTALEWFGQQRRFGHRGALDAVVRGHHHPGARGHRAFERIQVQLVQGAGRHTHIHGEAVGLGIVGDIVLRTGGHTVDLDRANVGGRDLGGQHRILGETFEMPSAEGGSVQIHRRPQHRADILAACLRRNQRTDLGQQISIPGGRQRGTRRQAHRWIPFVPVLTANTRRTVRYRHLGEPDRGITGHAEHSGPGDEP